MKEFEMIEILIVCNDEFATNGGDGGEHIKQGSFVDDAPKRQSAVINKILQKVIGNGIFQQHK